MFSASMVSERNDRFCRGVTVDSGRCASIVFLTTVQWTLRFIMHKDRD